MTIFLLFFNGSRSSQEQTKIQKKVVQRAEEERRIFQQ